MTFLLQPFVWHFPIIVIHLSKSENGSFDINNAYDLNVLYKIINEHPHFRSNFFAADGTKSLNALHQLTFDKYSQYIPDLINGLISIDEFIQTVKELIFVIPILDCLHSEKSGRDRIIDHNIKLGENVNIINKQNISDHLDLPIEILNDTSDIGRMNDNYPLILFTMQNTEILFAKQQKASGLYFIVYSLILEIFRNPFIHIISRSQISKLVLFLLILLYNDSNNLPNDTSLKKSKKKKYVWFNEQIGIISLINTMISICINFETSQTYYCLGLERESSHPDEQFFGRYRDKIIGYNVLKNAFSYAFRASLALDFEHDLHVRFTIPKRDNFGGTHLNFSDVNNKIYDTNSIFKDDLQFKAENFAIDLYKTCTGKKEHFDKDSLMILKQLFNFFHEFRSSNNKTISKTKGIAIVPRIINANIYNYRKNSFFEEYDKSMTIEEKNAVRLLYKKLGVEEKYQEFSDFEYSDNDISYEEEENLEKRRRIHLKEKRH